MTPIDRSQRAGIPVPPNSTQPIGNRASRSGEQFDVDDVFLENKLRMASVNPMALGNQAALNKTALAARQAAVGQEARLLSQQDLQRHSRLSGQEARIKQHALEYLRNRPLPPEQRLPDWQAGGRREGLGQYLGMLNVELALSRLRGAGNDAQAKADFLAAMAPVAGHYGSARELARKFYDAQDDNALRDLLSGSGLEPDALQDLIEDLKQSEQFEEVLEESGQSRRRMNYSPVDFMSRLARGIGLATDGQLDDAEIDRLLLDCRDRRGQIENDGNIGEAVKSTVYIAEVLEDVADEVAPDAFAESYAKLVLGEDSWAKKSLEATKLCMSKDGKLDLPLLQSTMLATARAAGLDMEARRDERGHLDGEDKARLQAAVESSKLLARLSSAAARVDEMRLFLERRGTVVSGAQLLTVMLSRMSEPHAPPTSFINMARSISPRDVDLAPTLYEFAAFLRDMPIEMFPDPAESTRQACRDNLLLALDEAARLEDDRLLAAGLDEAGVTPALPSPKPALPEPAERALPHLPTAR